MIYKLLRALEGKNTTIFTSSLPNNGITLRIGFYFNDLSLHFLSVYEYEYGGRILYLPNFPSIKVDYPQCKQVCAAF